MFDLSDVLCFSYYFIIIFTGAADNVCVQNKAYLGGTYIQRNIMRYHAQTVLQFLTKI